jgi:hypothetical protein
VDADGMTTTTTIVNEFEQEGAHVGLQVGTEEAIRCKLF